MVSPQRRAERDTIAIFDFDGTVSYGDTALAFLRQFRGRVNFWIKMVRLLPVGISYRLGHTRRLRVKEALLTSFLGGCSETAVLSASERYATLTLPALLNPRALVRLRWHADQGHRVLIVSSALEMHLNAWAKGMPVEAVLGTRLGVEDGRYTGLVNGPDCYGEEKVTRLQAYLGDLSWYEIFAYGDSSGDRPMLEVADHPEFRSFRTRKSWILNAWKQLKLVV